VIIALLVLAIILAFIFRAQVSEGLQSFATWISNHKVTGPLLLMLAYIITTVAFIPGSILTLGAGWAFKLAYSSTWVAVVVGTLSVWIGAEIGSCIAFLLGRFVFREQAEKLAEKYKITKALDKAIKTEGLKFVLLLRLCPLVPFNAFNYLMGVTGVSFVNYAIGGVGMIPGTIVYVFVGSTLGSITQAATGDFSGGAATIVLLIVGCILACGAIIWISIVVKRYLQQAQEFGSTNTVTSPSTRPVSGFNDESAVKLRVEETPAQTRVQEGSEGKSLDAK